MTTMMPGYNTDFSYRGLTFHVQTEDHGAGNPVVVSLLYHRGAILASRKTSYRELLGNPECTERLKDVMKAQHKALMRELLAGAYDEKIPAGTANAGCVVKPGAAAGGTPLVAAAPGGERGGSQQQPTLDEAITRHLEDHAAAAATAR
jgi:hypothetical protein